MKIQTKIAKLQMHEICIKMWDENLMKNNFSWVLKKRLQGFR